MRNVSFGGVFLLESGFGFFVRATETPFSVYPRLPKCMHFPKKHFAKNKVLMHQCHCHQSECEWAMWAVGQLRSQSMVKRVPSSSLHCRCSTTPTLLQVREGLAYSLHLHSSKHLLLLGSLHLHLLCCLQLALCRHLITWRPLNPVVNHSIPWSYILCKG